MNESWNMDFHHQYTQFDKMSREVVEELSPIMTRKINPSEAAWIDKEYRESRALRRKYERVWKSSRTEENRISYVDQKALCIEMADSKRTEFYSKLVEGSSGSQSALFKVANELLDKNSKKILPSHDDSKQLANEFNRYYVD